MECLFCGKSLQGGFSIGAQPYKAFRCAACLIADVEREGAELKKWVDRLNYAESLLREIDILCTPNRRGHRSRKALGQIHDLVMTRSHQ